MVKSDDSKFVLGTTRLFLNHKRNIGFRVYTFSDMAAKILDRLDIQVNSLSPVIPV